MTSELAAASWAFFAPIVCIVAAIGIIQTLTALFDV